MYRILLLFLVIPVQSSISQTINGISMMTDEAFIRFNKNISNYCETALEYREYASQPGDSSLYFNFLAYRIAQGCEDPIVKADAAYRLGLELTSHAENEMAKTYYDICLSEYIKMRDTLFVAKTYKAIGSNFKKMYQYPKALRAFNSASHYFHLTQNKEGIALIELNVGLVLKSLNRMEEAKSKYRNALNRFKLIQLPELVADCQNNLGNVFRKQGNYDSAFYYMYQTLSNRREHGPERKLGYIYHNLANAHMNINNLDSAEWYLTKSIYIKEKLGYKQELATDYLIYGDLYRKRKDYPKAIASFEKSRELISSPERLDLDYEVSKELAKTYYLTGNYKESAENYFHYFNLRDSLRLTNNPLEIQEEFLQYEFYKDSIETEKLRLERELQEAKYKNRQLSDRSVRNQLYFSLGILSLLIIMILLLFTSFRKRLYQARKHREILAEQNEELKRTLVSKEEKETLLKEIHHRVKNNLQIISSLVRLQSGYIDKTNFKERLNEIENRISSMALVHEKLYQSNDLSKLEVKSYIRDLSIKILESYQIRKKVRFLFDIDAKEFNIDTLIPLGLILNEAISNALKYAFNNQNEGIINIRVKSSKNGGTQMVISDNGIGAKRTVDELKEDSLGMDLIFSLTEQLEGSLEITTNEGFTLNFTFPHLQ